MYSSGCVAINAPTGSCAAGPSHGLGPLSAGDGRCGPPPALAGRWQAACASAIGNGHGRSTRGFARERPKVRSEVGAQG